MSRGAFMAPRLIVLLVAIGCHDATAPVPLVACRLTSVIPAHGEFPAARVSSCYELCPADAEAFAAAHGQEFVRVASCTR